MTVAPPAKPIAPRPVLEIAVGPEIPALGPAAEKKSSLGIRIDLGTRFKPIAREYDADLKINEDVTGKSRCAGEVDDFKNYFLNRFDILRKILKSSRREMSDAVSIARAKRSTGEVKVIGMVQTLNNTKNGHRIILLEDEEDSINLMINASNQDLLKLKVITDEVIGITGKINQKHDMIYLDEIYWPEIPMAHQSNSAQLPLSAAFISDIHLGSKTFLKKSWDRFLQWLSGKTGTKRENDIVSSIKYLVIAGDNVDGIGIYPGQYKDLDITDIYEQYESLAFEMERIPDYINVIMMPGNHDAVRPNEPQPAMHQELCEKFTRPITFTGNPCNMSLSGVDVLAYHGRSLDDFVTKFDNVTYETPLEAMKEMLNRRHMLPIYGEKTPIAPEPYDYMVIRKVPDIFVTGHVHSYGAKLYRGVICLNSSCWQSQTSYQKLMNFVPQPAKVPIVNLQTKVMSVMDFLAS